MGTTTLNNLRSAEGARDNEIVTSASEGMKLDRAKIGAQPNYQAVVMPPIGTGRYRFRTVAKLERKTFQIRLRLPQAMPENDKWDEMYRQYRGWVERQVRQGKIDKSEFKNQQDKLLRTDLEIRDIIGKYRIVFSRVRNSRESAFETDNIVVADYIRMRMKKGDFPEIYEDTRPLELSLNGKQVRVQGFSDDDSRLIADFLAEHGRLTEPEIEAGADE